MFAFLRSVGGFGFSFQLLNWNLYNEIEQ
jgi:hypothetical protein